MKQSCSCDSFSSMGAWAVWALWQAAQVSATSPAPLTCGPLSAEAGTAPARSNTMPATTHIATLLIILGF